MCAGRTENAGQISRATEGNYRTGGRTADAERGGFSWRWAGRPMAADRGDFRVALNLRSGSARIASGGAALQSQNERTEPRALRDSFEFEGPAGRHREAGCGAARASEDPLRGLGTGCSPRFFCERQ